MVEEITNVNDVVVQFENTKVPVSSFNVSEDVDTQRASGASYRKLRGVSHGNQEVEFEFSLDGENAEVFNSAIDGEGKPQDIQFAIDTPDGEWVIPHAWVTSHDFGGDDGDMVEYNASGIGNDLKKNY